MNLSRLKEEIKKRVDIVDLIGQTVELKQMGNVYVGLCPFPHGFHAGQPVYDSRPSLTVYPAQQTYYCYGCGAGDGQAVHGGASDIFGWIQNLHGVDFKTAVITLADYAGIPVEEAQPAADIVQELERVDALDRQYRQNLFSSKEAMAYLASRGVDEELIYYGRLGLVPPGTSPLIAGRISIGIADLPLSDGRVLTAGMAYRSLDGSLPKYINDRTSAHFSRRRFLYLFAQNLEHIKRERRVVLVEGYFDALALYRAGLKTACAAMGTILTTEQAALMARYANRVYVWFDGDYAGQQATLKALEQLFKAGLEAYVISVPGLDPDVYTAAADQDVTRLLEAHSIPALDWLMQYALQEYASVAEVRSRVLKAVRPVLDATPDPVRATVYEAQLRSILQLA